MPGTDEGKADLGVIRECGPINDPAKEVCRPPIISSPQRRNQRSSAQIRWSGCFSHGTATMVAFKTLTRDSGYSCHV
ncbi:hypothetical protein Ciccas_000858 [Cichlidogyrus casuarinus]|uniref:Uncharacterized protein n=1 Tax=Cichlidogyrus casuarinus TaxID=1844966 RepID=A0ABD2QLN9_9PLAT